MGRMSIRMRQSGPGLVNKKLGAAQYRRRPGLFASMAMPWLGLDQITGGLAKFRAVRPADRLAGPQPDLHHGLVRSVQDRRR
jgi:hypothetical protein